MSAIHLGRRFAGRILGAALGGVTAATLVLGVPGMAAADHECPIAGSR